MPTATATTINLVFTLNDWRAVCTTGFLPEQRRFADSVGRSLRHWTKVGKTRVTVSGELWDDKDMPQLGDLLLNLDYLLQDTVYSGDMARRKRLRAIRKQIAEATAEA